MILADHEIRELCESSGLVAPYLPENVQPASIDVRLGNEFRVFERDSTTHIDMADPADITKLVKIADDDYFLLHPGEFVLGSTVERVCMPTDLVSRIEGKSSVGRLGLMVHVTAGYIDPGFVGNVTLEMTCLHPLPIMLRPGRLIAQISFHSMASPAEKPYKGRYQNDTGPAASRYGQPVGCDHNWILVPPGDDHCTKCGAYR